MLNSKGNFKPFVEKRKATRGLKTLKKMECYDETSTIISLQLPLEEPQGKREQF